MRGGAVWLRTGCGLGALLGTYLLVSGLVRLVDPGGPTGGPVARLAVGVVLLAASAAALLVSRREPSGAASASRGPRAAPGAEVSTCPHCGETNAPSAQFCHGCERPLR